MPIINYRVDDRLIHGQVVIGWGKPLGIEFFVLVDPDVRQSDWEQDLYRMALPESIDIVFAGVDEARTRLAEWQADPRRGMLLTGTVAAMVALAGDGAIPALTLGGIHHRPKRRQRLPYVFLTSEEYGALTALAAQGIEVTAQDVPTGRKVQLKELE